MITNAKLVAMRRALSMTQTQFWGAIGVTQSAGSRYETDGRSMPKPVRILVATAYMSGSTGADLVAAARRKA